LLLFFFQFIFLSLYYLNINWTNDFFFLVFFYVENFLPGSRPSRRITVHRSCAFNVRRLDFSVLGRCWLEKIMRLEWVARVIRVTLAGNLSDKDSPVNDCGLPTSHGSRPKQYYRHLPFFYLDLLIRCCLCIMSFFFSIYFEIQFKCITKNPDRTVFLPFMCTRSIIMGGL
jgi:hypothetical protein